jgi:RHS repeat-associated protein
MTDNVTAIREYVYFGGRMVARSNGANLESFKTDRLHSNQEAPGGGFFPYGETKSGAAMTGESFATYSRDWHGLDYADQRWYLPTTGRFSTADPLDASSDSLSPQSASRYHYVTNDPGNLIDPSGLIGRDSGEDMRTGRFEQPAEACFAFGGYFCSWAGGGGGRVTPTDPQSLALIYGIVQPGQALSTATANWELVLGGALSSFVHATYGGSNQSAHTTILAHLLRGGDISIRITASTWEMINRIAPAIVIGGGIVLTEVIDAVGAAITITLFSKIIEEIFRKPFPGVEDLRSKCTPGRYFSEPASGNSYRGGISHEQEYICPGGMVYTVHWIDRGGRILHGPHVRPGPPKGGL